jgi:hypothetical protein
VVVGPAAATADGGVPARTDARATGGRWYDRPAAGTWIVLGLGLLSAWMLTAGIQTPWPWSDEGATYVALQRTWGQLAVLFGSPDAPIVPYYYVAKAWTNAVQALWPTMSTVVAVRLLSAAAATATVLVLYAIVARNAGRLAGVLSALVLLSLPGFDRYAQEARTYALLALAATVSWLLCDRRLRPGLAPGRTGGPPEEAPPSPPIRRLVAAGGHALSLAAVATIHTFGLFQWVAQAVELLSAPGTGRARRRRVASFAAVVVVAGGLTAAQVATSASYGTGPAGAAGLRVVTPVSTLAQIVRGLSVSTQPLVSLAPVAFVAVGAFSRPRGSRTFPRSLMVWLLVPLTLEIALGVVRTNLFRLRYWIAFLPPFAALAALGIVTIATSVVRVFRTARHGAGAAPGPWAIPATALIVLGLLGLQVAAAGSTQRQIRGADGHGQDLTTVLAVLARARVEHPGLVPVMTTSGASGMLAAADPALLAENPLMQLNPSARSVYTTAMPSAEVRRRLAGPHDLLWIYQGQLNAGQARRRMPRALAQLHPAVVWATPAGTTWTTLLLRTGP